MAQSGSGRSNLVFQSSIYGGLEAVLQSEINLYLVQTLVEHSNTVDFNIDACPVKNTAKASSCYFFASKIFTESFIKSWKISA